jgi:hypothetical protein
MADLVNWQSRLSVSYSVGTGKPEKITPIDSFQPSFSLNAEALHSIERTHIGVVYSPSQISFSMSVKAIGTAAAKLSLLALKGTPFDVVLEEGEGDPVQWSFKEVVLSGCVITSATPTSATISGAPAATFSGFALGGKVTAGAESAKIGA